ncbi:MAG: hypothetical protein QOE01_2044 [Actinomycetota bacterium]|nr:hypothetical protein [Actinomycetota bacterium]
MRPLAIAAVQTAPVSGDVEATWKKFADQVRGVRAVFPHVSLVVFPELYLAAVDQLLDETHEYAERVAVTVPGDLTGRLGELARETGLWLVPGSVYERGPDGKIFNSALALDPSGRLVASYRKCFPWQPFEGTDPGDEMVVFDIPGVARVGLAICYDGAFPEVFRQLAWFGAEVVLQPTLTATRDRDLEVVLARANAIVNQMYVVSVNACGPHGLGQSLVVDPEGLVRQQAGGNEEVIVDVLDLDAVTRVHEFGTFGLNRMWSQMDEHGPRLHLPMYEGGHYRPRPERG